MTSNGSEKEHKGPRFMKVFQPLQVPAGGSQARALLALMNAADVNNLCHMKIEDLARHLGVTIVTAHRAMAGLRQLDMVAKSGPGVYMLNPTLMATGTEQKRWALFQRYRLLRQGVDFETGPRTEATGG